jgi:Fe-S-cluster containining protein
LPHAGNESGPGRLPMLDPCVSVPCDARCCDAAEVPLLGSDIERLTEATGWDPERFVEVTPDRWQVLRGTGLDGCVFRGSVEIDGAPITSTPITGCTVHEARPEACRSYPFVLRTDDKDATLERDAFCPFAEEFEAPAGGAAALVDLERRLEEERRERPTG